MSWNYRVLDHGTHLAVHEVYYDRRGRVTGWSAEPTPFVGCPDEGVDSLRLSLAMALADAVRHPVLDAGAEHARLTAG